MWVSHHQVSPQTATYYIRIKVLPQKEGHLQVYGLVGEAYLETCSFRLGLRKQSAVIDCACTCQTCHSWHFHHVFLRNIMCMLAQNRLKRQIHPLVSYIHFFFPSTDAFYRTRGKCKNLLWRIYSSGLEPALNQVFIDYSCSKISHLEDKKQVEVPPCNYNNRLHGPFKIVFL